MDFANLVCKAKTQIVVNVFLKNFVGLTEKLGINLKQKLKNKKMELVFLE